MMQYKEVSSGKKEELLDYYSKKIQEMKDNE